MAIKALASLTSSDVIAPQRKSAENPDITETQRRTAEAIKVVRGMDGQMFYDQASGREVMTLDGLKKVAEAKTDDEMFGINLTTEQRQHIINNARILMGYNGEKGAHATLLAYMNQKNPGDNALDAEELDAVERDPSVLPKDPQVDEPDETEEEETPPTEWHWGGGDFQPIDDPAAKINPEFGIKFYEENKKRIDRIRAKWDTWRKGDNKVSDDDLEKDFADDEDAQWLLKPREEGGGRAFFDHIDALKTGDLDGKISDEDFIRYFHSVSVPFGIDQEDKHGPMFGTGFYNAYKSYFDDMIKNWRNWGNASSDGNIDYKISRDDMANPDYKYKDEPALKWLLNTGNGILWDYLDAAKTGEKDGKISDEDLVLYLQSVGGDFSVETEGEGDNLFGYDNLLNEFVANYASTINIDNDSIASLNDEPHRQNYKNMIIEKMYAEGGLDADVDDIRKEVNGDIRERLEFHLRNDPAKDEKMDIFDNYWNQQSSGGGRGGSGDGKEHGEVVAAQLASEALQEVRDNPPDDPVGNAEDDPLPKLMENYDVQDGLDEAGATGPVSFAEWLTNAAVAHSVKDVSGDFNRKEMLAHPDRFTTEERARAVVELELTLTAVTEGAAKGWNTESTGGRGNGGYGVAGSEKVKAALEAAITKISSPEVETWLGEHVETALDELRGTGLKGAAETLAKSMLQDPNINQLKDLWDNSDGNHFGALAVYASSFEVLNTFAGSGPDEPLIKHPVVNMDNFEHKDKIIEYMKNDFNNMNRLEDLINGSEGGKKMTPEEAVTWLAMRIPTYSFFGGNAIAMQDTLRAMATNYGMDHADWRSVWEANGGEPLSKEDYLEALETMKEVNPEIVPEGMDFEDAAAFLQKVDATIKAAGYWDMSKILLGGEAQLAGTPFTKEQIGAWRAKLKEVFKGQIQKAGMLIAGLWFAADMAKNAGSDDVKDQLKHAAIAMMFADYTLESFNRFMRNKPSTPKFPGIDVPWYETGVGAKGDYVPWLADTFNDSKPIPRTVWDSFNTAGKLLGGAGLGILGGVGLAHGIIQAQEGHIEGVAEAVIGGLNTVAGAGLFTDAALGAGNIGRFFYWNHQLGKVAGGAPTSWLNAMKGSINKAYIGNMGRIAAFFAPISFAANAAALAAMIGEGIASVVNFFTGEGPWRDDVKGYLEPYGITGR